MSKKRLLKNIIDDNYINLPEYYHNLNLTRFGLKKKLFDYQIEALKNILTVIHYYYDSKEKLFEKYQNNDTTSLLKQLNIYQDNDNFDFLKEYYPINKKNDGTFYIDFKELINRASIWMATGSGKTLVMIKLIELLYKMANKGFIPNKPIMILAPDNDILSQIKEHIMEFNETSDVKINLKSLKEFETSYNMKLDFYSQQSLTIFYYESTNISNKENVSQKSDGKRIDYESIYNNGNWYILLDEAHKGDSEYSRRQQYYNILSQNGFLFNFSATFTDDIDLVTTAVEFNLSTFVSRGFGKHIKIVDEEFRGFKESQADKLTDEEKQRIILKSLLLFTAIKKNKESIVEINANMYHDPLMITLTHKVNTKDSELKLFFRQIANIAKGNYEIQSAKNELLQSLSNNPQYQFNYGNEINRKLLDTIENIKREDILRYFFNADSPGSIEVTRIPNNNKELAFRLSSSSQHFASIIIGNISNWKNDELEGYNFDDTPVTNSFFNEIDTQKSNINMLMGSRKFYEGWDSNRPNIINFINIGLSSDSQKFILQAIGRGVRIEPFKNKRKRLLKISNTENITNYITQKEFKCIKDYSDSLETLFIFATDKETVNNIIERLEDDNKPDEWKDVRDLETNKDTESKILLVPKYRKLEDKLNNKPFRISRRNINTLKDYFKDIFDKILAVKYNLNISIIEIFKKLIDETENWKDYFEITGKDYELSSEDLLLKINRHFIDPPRILSHYELLVDQVNHYKEIKVRDFNDYELSSLEESIQQAINIAGYNKEDLRNKFRNGEISDEEFDEKYRAINEGTDFTKQGGTIEINNKLLNHYYQPLLMSDKETQSIANDIKHIIDVKSEIEFLKDLQNYTNKSDNNLKNYDWWFFSKLDETIDNITIPYYDESAQQYRDFKPDFIFWLKKDNKYIITFVDPKGIEHVRNPGNKIDGFEETFKNKAISYEDKEIEVNLYYYNEDLPPSIIEENHKKYWEFDLNKIF
ncbi:DEAD/DEAH box helicase family protein [Orenia marismortui]|uniref:DEAD/DEAH box helicase family protein n=1 Tax=Orenia marismortui TaxID=46469 RepID=UPI00037FD2BC|nr:DEAD/DEAH box helicase family protein [Orenia marismortui]